MAQQTTDTDREPLTPEDVREQARAFEGDPFGSLLTPQSRAVILGVLVENHIDNIPPRTAQEIVDQRDSLSISSFNRERDELIDVGVMEMPEKRGNARTYRLNPDHPLAQLFVMVQNVWMTGDTPLVLEDDFVANP